MRDVNCADASPPSNLTDLNIDNGSNDLSDLSNTGGYGRTAEGTGSACCCGLGKENELAINWVGVFFVSDSRGGDVHKMCVVAWSAYVNRPSLL